MAETSAWMSCDLNLAKLGPRARMTLLRILEAPSTDRAAAIGRVHQETDGGDLAELLVELEDKLWARQWFIERLRGPTGDW